jgi:hypothetical protein
LRRIVHANGIFVASGDTGYPSDLQTSLLASEDGQNWRIQFPCPAFGIFRPALAYGNGTFLAIRSDAVFKSADGFHWSTTPVGLPLTDAAWFIYYNYRFLPALCAYKGRFIVGGHNGILMQSDDTRVLVLAGSPRMTDQGFTFLFNPQIGEPYRIQMSTNLEFWENLYEDVAAAQPTTFNDSSVTISPKRFFRVVSP